MDELKQEFRTPRWLQLFLAAAAAGAGAAAVVWVYFYGTGRAWLPIAALLMLTAAAMESATTCVTLGRRTIVILQNFRRTEILREDIDSVTWAAGTGVSLKLKSGAWVKLPDVGNSQSRANSIRAWIRRAEDGGGVDSG